MATITLVQGTPGKSAAAEVTAEVRQDVEDTFEIITKTPGLEGQVTFADKPELVSWVAQVRRYCRTREQGALKFRLLPSKNLGDLTLRFTLAAKPAEPAEDADTEIPAGA
jgi:hypothetical protein